MFEPESDKKPPVPGQGMVCPNCGQSKLSIANANNGQGYCAICLYCFRTGPIVADRNDVFTALQDAVNKAKKDA